MKTPQAPRWFRLPREAYQLAEKYGLGTPQRVHTQQWDRSVVAGCGGFFLFIGLWNLISLILGLYSLQEGKPSGPGPWVGVALAFLFATPFLISAASFKSVAYECSAGFLVVSRKSRRLVIELKWNEVERAWHSLAYKGRRYFIAYRKGNHDPEQQYELLSKHLWKRCDFEVRHRRVNPQRQHLAPRKRSRVPLFASHSRFSATRKATRDRR